MPEVIRNADGKPFSKWKPAEKFAYAMAREYPAFSAVMQTEYAFDDERKWRMDFAWPTVKVAVEIDGFGFGHQAQQCIAADHEKQNAAVEQGWRVLRFCSRQLGSKAAVAEAVEQAVRVVCDWSES